MCQVCQKSFAHPSSLSGHVHKVHCFEYKGRYSKRRDASAIPSHTFESDIRHDTDYVVEIRHDTDFEAKIQNDTYSDGRFIMLIKLLSFVFQLIKL